MQNIQKEYYSLAGELQKLSTSVFIGYQKKYFAILENGTKIAYRNLDEQQFLEKNTFLIKQVAVCEAEDEFSFTLETPKKIFILKAIDEQTKIKWMRALTKIKKQIIRKKFASSTIRKVTQKPNQNLSSTSHTLPLGSLTLLNLNETQQSIQSSYLPKTQRNIRTSTNLLSNPQNNSEIKNNYLELLKNIPEDFLKFHIYVGNLKSKVDNLFTASYTSSTYILFSSKSLYPLEHISDENLSNIKLPAWAQVNKMYKISPTNIPKLFLQVSKILDIEQQINQKNLLKIRTSDNVHSFFCQTVEQKQRFQKVFNQAIDNLKEVIVDNKMTKRNYDKLVHLFNNHYDEFLEKAKQLVEKYVPKNEKYQPQIVIKFIDSLLPFVLEFTSILKNKKQNCDKIILHLLKQFHEQIKVQIKLTWDTSYINMKASDIIKFLNALSAYHSIIKDYISDKQFMSGMKQLSKIYVRQSWKNFEDIILGIVEQQKRDNIFQDDDSDYIETNAVIDLFKFIYEVFDLASPCWPHKLHLHNVQKLMYRAISVYIGQMKSIVDETVISNKQLIAISNNCIQFSKTIDQFYTEKFSSLQQKTRDSYDKLKMDYKELSMIVLDKLAFDMRSELKKFIKKSNFWKIDTKKLYEIIKIGSENLSIDLLHQYFQKRFYEKLFSTIKQNILHLLEQQVSSKKKNNINKILQYIQNLSFDLIQICGSLYTGTPQIDKQLNEVNILLSSENHNEILGLLKGSGEDIRNVYINLLNLRQDYYVGGPLYYIANEDNLEKSSTTGNSMNLSINRNSALKPVKLSIQKQMEMRASFSSFYINDFDSKSCISKHSDDPQPLRLISEGYLMKCKVNKKVWEKQYFRLKNGIFYFYQNQKSQKSQNSIAVVDMIRIIPHQKEPLGFIIAFTSLNRQKDIQFKCQTLQLRQRWMESIGLEIKRIKNEEKVKRQKLKFQEKKKNYLIIDYEQLMNGKGFFSYSSSS